MRWGFKDGGEGGCRGGGGGVARCWALGVRYFRAIKFRPIPGIQNDRRGNNTKKLLSLQTLCRLHDSIDFTPNEQIPENRTESFVVFIPVSNRESRILQPNEDNCGFGTVFIPLLLGVKGCRSSNRASYPKDSVLF